MKQHKSIITQFSTKLTSPRSKKTAWLKISAEQDWLL